MRSEAPVVSSTEWAVEVANQREVTSENVPDAKIQSTWRTEFLLLSIHRTAFNVKVTLSYVRIWRENKNDLVTDIWLKAWFIHQRVACVDGNVVIAYAMQLHISELIFKWRWKWMPWSFRSVFAHSCAHFSPLRTSRFSFFIYYCSSLASHFWLFTANFALLSVYFSMITTYGTNTDTPHCTSISSRLTSHSSLLTLHSLHFTPHYITANSIKITSQYSLP